jgi:hypothetical protein
MGVWCMIRATLSNQQQQVTVRIICNTEGLDKHYFLNDFINVLLLSGRKCCAYHASHTHVRAVAVSRSFGRWQYLSFISVDFICISFLLQNKLAFSPVPLPCPSRLIWPSLALYPLESRLPAPLGSPHSLRDLRTLVPALLLSPRNGS